MRRRIAVNAWVNMHSYLCWTETCCFSLVGLQLKTYSHGVVSHSVNPGPLRRNHFRNSVWWCLVCESGFWHHCLNLRGPMCLCGSRGGSRDAADFVSLLDLAWSCLIVFVLFVSCTWHPLYIFKLNLFEHVALAQLYHLRPSLFENKNIFAALLYQPNNVCECVLQQSD